MFADLNVCTLTRNLTKKMGDSFCGDFCQNLGLMALLKDQKATLEFLRSRSVKDLVEWHITLVTPCHQNYH